VYVYMTVEKSWRSSQQRFPPGSAGRTYVNVNQAHCLDE
jgi:hypothetical protein